jgi:uncharacterized membrane protein (DUF4010 family)
MWQELLQGPQFDHLLRFAIALAIGLLIGLERERRPEAKAGLRTFALAGVFGAVCALLSEQTGSAWVLAAGLAVIGLMTSAAYLRERDPGADPGTTTVAAISICFALGAMVWYGHTVPAVALAIVTTILLYFKAELEGAILSLTRRDLVSILQFAVLTFIVLPLLPDRNYGPYSAFNPHQIWLMVVLISGVSLAGYVALRIVGQRHGSVLLGLSGGLVSSTATTLVYARHGAIAARMVPLASVVILLANLVVLARIAVLGGIVAPSVLPLLAPVLAGGTALGLLGTIAVWRRLDSVYDLPTPEISNPTEIGTALGFGALYAAVLLLAAWLSDVAGAKGLYAVAIVSGLTDVDAITLSSLRLLGLGSLSPLQAVTAVTLAIMSNMAFKLGLVFAIGGRALGSRCAVGMLATLAGLGIALWLAR